jgi:hypothetical protein
MRETVPSCLVTNLTDADIGSLCRSGGHPGEPEEQNTEERDQRKPDGEARVNGGHDDPSFCESTLFKRFNKASCSSGSRGVKG